jgi:integrase
MVLLLALDRLSIDLGARLASGKLLDLWEIDEIAATCRSPFESHGGGTRSVSLGEDVVHLTRHPNALHRLAAETASIRMHYIHDYMTWMVSVQASKSGMSGIQIDGAQSPAKSCLAALAARFPRQYRNSSDPLREGLPEQEINSLLSMTEPDADLNPWRGSHAKTRNSLIVRWLLWLGIRRGELLGLRVRDINFSSNEVSIVRRADDASDPRKLQPNVKTKGRLLPMSDELASRTHEFISQTRRQVRGARQHDFLFVASGSGRPMTLSALNKIFTPLQRSGRFTHPLSAHVLRHCWNDRFSKLMDELKVSEEVEKQMRCRLMGWSETSNTGSTYTRRHMREKARAASLNLQHQLQAR